jgi:hypothetical protein
MNPTSRAIFQSVLGSDGTLTPAEHTALSRVLNGAPTETASSPEHETCNMLLSQKKAAKLLDVSRVTIWRMTKECILHPVEILPGTWRYSYAELARLAQSGKKESDAEGTVAIRRQAAA